MVFLHRVGTDLVYIPRIADLYERYGEQFLDRVYTEHEQGYALSAKRHLASRLAGRWAAKEAVSKALGTGWRGVGYRDIEVVRLGSGEPTIHLHGRAARRVERYGPLDWQVSFSHDRDYAVATVSVLSKL
ncbi:holo-ACP synthase [Gloeobacter kilaueensis]|uniref:Holo-[acyl-carrier-protein] synthase n=1 Tax=Gloeobacter kilaueensis (strain ATCC BAA-2537 / CCAP 1431/1 / ULC 316 / JS1) TaxID=1183438 RepID=U5QJ15_GLOK1|nr:holo-ACP synthase [Gloeobacter kilaueensis]AGY58972.1 4'-phosphopantetheinyl transferase [Gloeobacter kilaueensis JS1]